MQPISQQCTTTLPGHVSIKTAFASALLLLISACGGGEGDSTLSDNTSGSSQAEAYSDILLDLDAPLSQEALASIERYNVMFPASEIPPPIIDSLGNLPGWHDISTSSFKRFVYPSQNRPLRTDPHFFQFNELPENFDNNLNKLLYYVAEETGLPSVDLSNFVDVEAWTQIFGVGLRAGFNRVTFQGEKLDWFIDVLGIREDGKVLVNVIYAPIVTFDSWDGILLPLVFNGSVEDPEIFASREVFKAGTAKQKTEFYAAMVNTKVISEFNAFVTLSAGAQQAMDNAVTISACGSSNNCTISYVGGNAIADYN